MCSNHLFFRLLISELKCWKGQCRTRSLVSTGAGSGPECALFPHRLTIWTHICVQSDSQYLCAWMYACLCVFVCAYTMRMCVWISKFGQFASCRKPRTPWGKRGKTFSDPVCVCVRARVCACACVCARVCCGEKMCFWVSALRVVGLREGGEATRMGGLLCCANRYPVYIVCVCVCVCMCVRVYMCVLPYPRLWVGLLQQQCVVSCQSALRYWK